MPLTLVKTSEPVIETIPLDSVKSFLNIAASVADDDLLSDIIFNTTEYLEAVTHRQFLTASFRYSLDCFPMSTGWKNSLQWAGDSSSLIRIPRSPLQEVLSITYQDTSNVETTLSPASYGVDTDSEPGRIYLLPGRTWPATYNIPNAVKICFLAGWPSVDEIPRRLRSLLLLVIGDLYHYRRGTSIEDFIQEVPYVKRLIRSMNIGDVY